MRIELKKLMKLPVQTKSGAELGRIKDIVFEVEGQSVVQYEVGGMLGKKYLISREQVISIDEKKMMVEDGVVGVGTGLDLSAKKINIEPEGAIMSEQQ